MVVLYRDGMLLYLSPQQGVVWRENAPAARRTLASLSEALEEAVWDQQVEPVVRVAGPGASDLAGDSGDLTDADEMTLVPRDSDDDAA